MHLPRRALALRAAPAVALLAAIPVLRGAEPTTSARVERAPDPVELQARVDEVLARALPAVVGVQVGGLKGSGVIVSPDGLVLTAAHVIGGAGREARVFLADGTELAGRTLGAGHERDSGMLRIEGARDLPFVNVPPPGAPEVGAWCLALGHPGGYEPGRPAVPRLGRVLDPAGQFPRTDCALIGGDSGGPLFDLDGRLIGIHSRIEEDVADNFHVPMASFRLGWDRLLASEEWSRKTALLGVRVAEAASLGALLELVEPESAAEAAGLRAGDVVLGLEGELVFDSDELVRLLADLEPGDEIALELTRDGVRVEVPVVLGRAERRERRR